MAITLVRFAFSWKSGCRTGEWDTRVMLSMWSDGSYEGGDAPEDYAAWAAYDESLRSAGVFLDSGRFESTGAHTVVTALSESRRAGAAPADPSHTGRAALVGYYVLECHDLENAIRYARRAPLYGAVEVRALSDR